MVKRTIRKSLGFACLVGVGCFLLAIFDLEGANQGAWAGAAIGIPLGLCGAICGVMLMNILHGNGYLMTWAPAGLADSRRIGLREGAPRIVYWLLVAVAITLAGHLLRPAHTLPGTFTAGVLAFLAGACFIGGKWSCLATWLAVVGGFLTLVFGERFFPEVVTPATFAANAWPPSLAWSAINGLAALPAAAGIACALMVAESVRGWRRVWRADILPPALDAIVGDDELVETAEDEALQLEIHNGYWPRIPKAEQPQAEERGAKWRRNMRDRFLTHRCRRLAVFGDGHAKSWVVYTKWAALFLLIAVCMVMLDRHKASLGLPWPMNRIIAAWSVPVTLISIFIGIMLAWPGRNSAFAWMTQPQSAFGMGALPPLAVFPFTTRDWLAAAAREWLARSLWVGAMMLALLVLIMEPDFWQTWMPGRIALVALPWMLVLSLFPLQAIHRISLAASGAMFRVHGTTRTLPALMLAVVCPAACFTAVVATAGREPMFAAWAFGIALASGALSLRLALARAEGPRLDLKS